ncbi:MAG: 30S ribosomal protein S16 [Candidatus Binatia bacterium]
MSVTIRLARHGARKHPFYRIVVADKRSPRDGRYIEQVGTYDPSPNPAKVIVKRDKLEKWLSKGARPTDTVATVLKRAGLPSAAPAAPAPAA